MLTPSRSEAAALVTAAGAQLSSTAAPGPRLATTASTIMPGRSGEGEPFLGRKPLTP
jgi:hypothetical protein